MLTAPAPAGETPTAGLLASLALWHRIETDPVAHARLTIAHPLPRAVDHPPHGIEARMRGLADSLGLAPSTATVPDIGPRLFLHRGCDVVLSLDGCKYLLHAPVGRAWARFVERGGPVLITVGLDPLRAHAPLGLVETYLTERASTDRLFHGATHAEPPWEVARCRPPRTQHEGRSGS